MNPKHIKTTAHHNPNPIRSRVFTVKFFSSPILTVVTSTPAVARDWVYKLRRNHNRDISNSSLVLGLGVQWRVNFTSGNSQPAATLQISDDTDCLIFQLHHASAVPDTLRHLLSDDRITFVGVHNGRDKRALANSRHNLEVGKLVNLGRGFPKWSMEEMALILLGADDVVKPEELSLSNWEAFYLSDDQVQFACVDAFVSYLLAGALGYYTSEPINRIYFTEDGGVTENSNGGRLSEYYSYNVVEDDNNSGGRDDDSFVIRFTWHNDDHRNVVVRQRRPDFFVTYTLRPDGSPGDAAEITRVSYADDDNNRNVAVVPSIWCSTDQVGDNGDISTASYADNDDYNRNVALVPSVWHTDDQVDDNGDRAEISTALYADHKDYRSVWYDYNKNVQERH